MPDHHPRTTLALSPDQEQAVRDLADAAFADDGIRPLSERFLLALGDTNPAAPHVVTWDEGGLTAYGRVLDDTQGELVIAPRARRRGIGAAVLTAMTTAGLSAVWAHGDLPAARALARSAGFARDRVLRKLSRPLRPADAQPPTWPDGLTIRGFRTGDEEAWLRVNARAFAHHPEQGRVTRADFDILIAQPWFEPAGLLLLTDRHGVVVGSHWTKVDPRERAPGADGIPVPAGEVYVVALDPQYHGRGLSGPLTRAGLAHLAGRAHVTGLDRLSDEATGRTTGAGVGAVVLYVDDDNLSAMATYRRLGFADLEVHARYAPLPHAAPATDRMG